jgi:hypothetical protein
MNNADISYMSFPSLGLTHGSVTNKRTLNISDELIHYQ